MNLNSLYLRMNYIRHRLDNDPPTRQACSDLCRYGLQAEDFRLVGGGTVDALDRVDRQDLLLPVQFETQFAQYRKDRGEAGEVHSPITVWRRRGQSHRKPTFRVHGEQAANIGAVHRWKIGPVLDVADEVVHTYGACVQRMTKADDKGMAAFRRGIEDAIFPGDR